MSYWTCQRRVLGTPCRRVNPAKYQLCRACGGRKPKRRVPKHMQALELSYADYVKLQGGEFCGVCGREPSDNRRLDRDHDHVTGKPRGLCCHRCNRGMPNWADVEWFERALAYLKRAQER